MQMTGDLAEAAGRAAAGRAGLASMRQHHDVRVSAADACIDRADETGAGAFQNVVVGQDKPSGALPHGRHDVQPESMAGRGGEHVIGDAQALGVVESLRLTRASTPYCRSEDTIATSGSAA